MKFLFQRIQDHWIWRPVQGDMARILDVARYEIRDRLQRWDEMDITLLFGINFGWIRTCWKEKFIHFAMEQCFSTGSVLEIERKIREDEAAMGQRGIEGGDDDVKQWLGPWLSSRRSWRKIEATKVKIHWRWYSYTWGKDFKNCKMVHLLLPRLASC